MTYDEHDLKELKKFMKRLIKRIDNGTWDLQNVRTEAQEVLDNLYDA